MTDTAHGGWPEGRIIPAIVSDFEGTVKVSASMSQTLLPLLKAPITTSLLLGVVQDYEAIVITLPPPPPPVVAPSSVTSALSASGATIYS